MGEGIVFSTVFFWRLRPEIGSNCHPVGSSSKTPSDALQAFSMETGQAGGESVAECGSGGRFSAGGRFYQVKSAIEHNGHFSKCKLTFRWPKLVIFIQINNMKNIVFKKTSNPYFLASYVFDYAPIP